MKKYIFGFLVAVSLTACSNSVETETKGEEPAVIECVDSIQVVKDTIK
jgi:hypothetical protein